MQEQLIDNSLMVWETNYWAFLEENKKWIPTHWVKVSDHDDTMITKFPTELYIFPLNWLNYNFFDETILPNIPGFHCSSISYSNNNTDNNEYLICRMINYNLSDNGKLYIYSSSNYKIDNVNILINLNNKTHKILFNCDYNVTKHYNCHTGLEDIRLYSDMTISANSVSYGNGKVPQIIYGDINLNDGTITNIKHIKSPKNENQCEKNWIFLPKHNNDQDILTSSNDDDIKKYIIYRWFPFEIGILNNNNEVKIILSLYLTPLYFFRNMRGSTSFINYNIHKPNCDYNGNWLIGLTHYSIDQPNTSNITRKYYHVLILLNPITYIPIFITSPFTFLKNHGIEFCIGMKFNSINRIFTFWCSIMDKSPIEFNIHEDQFDFNIQIGNYKNSNFNDII
jgi:hypothetical protein